MVIIVEGNKEEKEITDEDILSLIKKHSKEYQGRKLVDFVSETYNLRRNKVYSIYNKIEK